MAKKYEKKVPPRVTPDQDSKYMALAWVHAGFSKDPNTQVGAQIVSCENEPLGSGYNGPPREIDDESFSWARPDPKTPPEKVTKYDLVIHAEENAINHSCKGDLTQATLYVTAFPCQHCMLRIIKEGIGRVVYMDYLSDGKGTLNDTQRQKSQEIAQMGGVRLEPFTGNINWLQDWVTGLEERGVFELT